MLFHLLRAAKHSTHCNIRIVFVWSAATGGLHNPIKEWRHHYPTTKSTLILQWSSECGSICNNCGKELLEDLLQVSSPASSTRQLNPNKGPLEFCQQCIFQMSQAGFGQWPTGDFFEVPFTPLTQSPTPSVEESPVSPPVDSMPTNIKSLVTDLAERAPLEKRWACIMAQVGKRHRTNLFLAWSFHTGRTP